jgi:enoyl-CoA hydratase/carnithine racemase
VTAQTAYEWGVVAEVVANGKALARARELATLYLKAPEASCGLRGQSSILSCVRTAIEERVRGVEASWQI